MAKTPYEIVKEAMQAELEEDIHSDRYQDGARYHRELLPFHNENIFRKAEWQPDIPNWPLTPQQLREVDRAILQQPEWLAYYARFDWRSWQHPSDWHYDRHRNRFVFFNVPALCYHNGEAGPDRRMLELTPDGTIDESRTKSAYDIYVTLPSCIDVCRDLVKRASPKLKFLRGQYFIRFGMWPKNERSRNWLIRDEEVFEKGVSAYHASYDLDDDRWMIETSVNEDTIMGTMQSLIYGNKPIFLVQGEEQADEGSDGEPLLHNVKLVKQLNKNDVYVPGIFDPREDEEN